MAQDSDEVARNANPVTPTPPATSPPSASTDELRARIHETRAEMSQTINAIQERLSPDHLVSETKDAIKDATVERAKQVAQGASRAADIARDSFENPGRVVQRVRANPVPAAAVMGVAAMWLAVRALRRPRAAHKDRSAAGRRGTDNVAPPQCDRSCSTEWPTASRCRHRHGLLGDVEGPTLGVRRSTIGLSSGRDRRTTGRVGWRSTSLEDTPMPEVRSLRTYLITVLPRLLDATHQLTTVLADFPKRAATPVFLSGTDSRMSGKPKVAAIFWAFPTFPTPPLATGGRGGGFLELRRRGAGDSGEACGRSSGFSLPAR